MQAAALNNKIRLKLDVSVPSAGLVVWSAEKVVVTPCQPVFAAVSVSIA